MNTVYDRPMAGPEKEHSMSEEAPAIEQVLALGATRADDIYAGGRWQVFRDPEGNEFCILRPRA